MTKSKHNFTKITKPQSIIFVNNLQNQYQNNLHIAISINKSAKETAKHYVLKSRRTIAVGGSAAIILSNAQRISGHASYDRRRMPPNFGEGNVSKFEF